MQKNPFTKYGSSAEATSTQQQQTKDVCNWKRNALKADSNRNVAKWNKNETKNQHYKEYADAASNFQFVCKESQGKKERIHSTLSMWQPNNQQRHSLNGKILREKSSNNDDEQRTDSKPWHYHYGKGIPVMWMRLLTVFFLCANSHLFNFFSIA